MDILRWGVIFCRKKMNEIHYLCGNGGGDKGIKDG